MLAIYIGTKNTPAGNPRRGWLIADDNGDFTDFVDEGYMGNKALAQSGYPGIVQTSAKIPVPPNVYRDAILETMKK
jgi:hypothetical protein